MPSKSNPQNLSQDNLFNNISVHLPKYQTKVGFLKNELKNVFCMVATTRKSVMLFFVCPSSETISLSEHCDGELRCFGYGYSNVEVTEAYDVLFNYVHEIKNIFHERDLNGNLISEFISAYRRSILVNENTSKGLAVENLVVFLGLGSLSITHVDFKGDCSRIKVSCRNPSFEIFGGYDNPGLGKLIASLKKINFSADHKEVHAKIRQKLRTWPGKVFDAGFEFDPYPEKKQKNKRR